MQKRLWRQPAAIKIKICGVDSVGFALDCYDLGVDAIGFHLWRHECATKEAHKKMESFGKIMEDLPADLSSVLVTDIREPRMLARIVSRVPFDAVQLHAPFDQSLLRCCVETLRSVNDELKTICVLAIGEAHNAMELAALYSQVCDALLLDSRWKGGSGRTHDWSRSAKIVLQVDSPCLLAGGLRASNVARAIQAVQPYGVDVQSGVERNTSKVKSLLKVQEFVACVRSPKNESRVS